MLFCYKWHRRFLINGTEDFSNIVRFNNLYKFWIDLEAWVRAMLIDCPEKKHDPWYKKWEGCRKFHLGEPSTAQSTYVVLIMEDMTNDYTILQIFEALTEQIPFLSNHIFFTSAHEEKDESLAVKLKMFQGYDYVNPFHQPTFNNPSNAFNALAQEHADDDGDDNEKML